MSRLLRLYPRAWRARYGAELEDLVLSKPLGLGGAIDLVRGAVDAHRHPELVDPDISPTAADAPVSKQRYADLVVAQRLGMGAWFGAGLWILGSLIAANGPVIQDDGFSYRDGSAGMPFMFGALVLLAAGLAGQLIRLPAHARMARLGAVVALIAAPLWGLGPWVLWLGAGLAIGLVVLALGAWWHGAWAGWQGLSMAGGLIAGVAVIFVAMSGIGIVDPGMEPAMFLILAALPVWLVVGGTLQGLPSAVEPEPIGEGLTERPITA